MKEGKWSVSGKSPLPPGAGDPKSAPNNDERPVEMPTVAVGELGDSEAGCAGIANHVSLKTGLSQNRVSTGASRMFELIGAFHQSPGHHKIIHKSKNDNSMARLSYPVTLTYL